MVFIMVHYCIWCLNVVPRCLIKNIWCQGVSSYIKHLTSPFVVTFYYLGLSISASLVLHVHFLSLLNESGEAEAILARAQATAKGIEMVSQTLKEHGGAEVRFLKHQ